jgi:hypothetical protein
MKLRAYCNRTGFQKFLLNNMHWPAKPRPFTGLLYLYPPNFIIKKTSVVTVPSYLPFSATIFFEQTIKGTVSRDEYLFEGPKNQSNTVLFELELMAFLNFWLSFYEENPK